MATTNRRVLVLVLGALAGMVVAASAAFACAAITSITMSSSSAAAGSTLDFRGDAFRDGPEQAVEDGPRPVSDVVVRWNSRTGEELWSGRSENRTIAGSITVPAGTAPGQYMIVATQSYTDTGDPVPGSPARVSLEVTGAAASGAAVSSASLDETAAAPAASEESTAPAAPAAAEESTAPAAAAESAPVAAGETAAAASTVEQRSAATQPAAAASVPQESAAPPAAAAEPAAASSVPQQSAAAPPVAATTPAHGGVLGMPSVREYVAPGAVTSPSPVVEAAPHPATAVEQVATTPRSVVPTAVGIVVALLLAMGATRVVGRRRRRLGLLAVTRLP